MRLALILLLPAIAYAAPETNDEGYQVVRQVVPATDAPSLVAQSKVIYLNRNGVTLQPGDNDARTNHSTLAKVPTTIPPWSVSPAIWDQTVACMKELFAPFDVTVVQTDPGPTVQHIEAVFGGQPSMLGMDATVMGVAPFKADCSILENNMVFTFADHIPQDARLACETMAQEVAHAYGLDHEMLPGDPMTYLRNDGNRSFQNQLAECGESKARMCGPEGIVCRGKQNTVELLFARLGAKAMPNDFTPPTVAITSPANGATVSPGFEITVAANDNTRVTMATLYVDNVPSGSSSVAPWTVRAPDSILKGNRSIKIEVTDGRSKSTTEIHVNVEGGTSQDDLGSAGCSTGGSPGLLLALLALTTRRAGNRRSARSR